MQFLEQQILLQPEHWVSWLNFRFKFLPKLQLSVFQTRKLLLR